VAAFALEKVTSLDLFDCATQNCFSHHVGLRCDTLALFPRLAHHFCCCNFAFVYMNG
jgi:hypothetical protein